VPTNQGTVSPLFVWNLVSVILLGTAACLWAAYFSDMLPEVSAILSGGGLFIWGATAFSLLTSKRQEKIKHWTESVVLGSGVFSIVLIVCFLVLVVLANFLGSVDVESIAEEPEHSVAVYAEGTTPLPPDSQDWKRLAPAQGVRLIVWTSWFSPTRTVVKVRGYPDKIVNVRPFRRLPVVVPYSVRSPVVLLCPEAAVIEVARGASMKMEIQTTDDQGGSVTRTVAFDGHAVLIGGDEEIELPAELEEKWRNQLRNRPDVFHMWAKPDAPAEFAMRLKPRQILKVRLLQKNNKPYGPQIPVVVNPLQSTRSFVQEIVLYGP
jgi:hypothetical protein